MTGATAVALLLGLSAAESLPLATRRAGLLSAAAVLLLAVLLLAVNWLPYPGTRGAWSGAELVDFLAPWWLPLLGGLGMLLAGWRRPLSALGPLGVVALGGLYYAYGSTQLDGSERWFVYFNAERFLHLGLLMALPVAAGGATRAGLAASLLVVGSAVFFPNPMANSTHSLRDAPPLVLDGTDLAWFERIRRETPPDARFFTNLGSYALPAFTGRTQNPIESNLWGNNTLPASEFNARLSDASSFLQRGPEAQSALLERWGYSHVFLRRDGVRGEVTAWLQQLRRGGFQLIAEDERYLLFAKATAPPGAALGRGM